MGKIIESSKQVEGEIHRIATAANEQTVAAGEIAESVTQIAQLATHNSDAAGKAAETSKNLSALVKNMNGIISQFRIESRIEGNAKPGARRRSGAGAAIGG